MSKKFWVITSVTVLLLIALGTWYGIISYRKYTALKTQSGTTFDLADQKDFDILIYEGETKESARIRSGAAGTGFVYFHDDGEVMAPPQIYVFNVQGGAPKYTFEAMYMWPYGSPDEGAERMVCVQAEGYSDTPGDVSYYCEAESIHGSD